MGKLIFAINLTADGCCDHTRGLPNDEVHEYFAQLTREAGVLVYGRKTYELMVPFWPDMAKSNSGPTKAVNDFAHAFSSIGKIVVFSKSFEKAEGGNTTIVRSNLRDEIMKLKQEQGNDILTGGVDIPKQLLQLGLVDEFRIVIHPIISGEGRRLFADASLPEELQLKLIESRVFKSGHVALRYVKQGA